MSRLLCTASHHQLSHFIVTSLTVLRQQPDALLSPAARTSVVHERRELTLTLEKPGTRCCTTQAAEAEQTWTPGQKTQSDENEEHNDLTGLLLAADQSDALFTHEKTDGRDLH